MIAARRLQRSFADGLIAEEVQDLWEPWMRHADEALNDDQLLQIIQQELSKRYKKSKTCLPNTSSGVESDDVMVSVAQSLLKFLLQGGSLDITDRNVG